MVVSPAEVFLYDLKDNVFRSAKLETATVGVQLMPTPDGAILAAIRRSEGRWVFDAYSLKSTPDAPLFQGLKQAEELSTFSDLPAVRK